MFKSKRCFWHWISQAAPQTRPDGFWTGVLATLRRSLATCDALTGGAELPQLLRT